MMHGISFAFLYIVLQYGLLMFIYPQSIIQSQVSGHWIIILIGWLMQGGLLRLLIGGFHKGNDHLLSSFKNANKMFRILLVWPLIAGNIFAITIIIRGQSQIVSSLFLPETPRSVLMALMLVTAICVSYTNRDSLLRLAFLLGLFGLPLLLLSLAASFSNVTVHFLLPLQPNFSFLTNPVTLPLFFVFSHVIGLIGFFGPLNSVGRKWIWGAWGFSLLFLLLYVYLPLGVFGREVAVHLRFPLISVFDTIRVNWFFFDRISLLYIMATMFSTLLNICGLLWLIRQLTSSTSISRFVTNPFMIGFITIILALYIVDWRMLVKILEWGSLLRLVLIVAIALVAAFQRGRRKLGG